ncbi:hypothetical protein JI57_03475 [Psychromonas sp. PRT-SC03]|nr:hypothetical protein JI57_03475 [Psychromonas sp. PRT-SC03]
MHAQGKPHQNKQQGFAIFTMIILLTMACLTFSLKIASIVRWENQRLANQYRNLEAFTHAGSGLNFILSQLDNASGALRIAAYLDNLCHLSSRQKCPPYFESRDLNFSIRLSLQAKGISELRSTGSSQDGQAHKKIYINVQLFNDFPLCIAQPKSKNIDNKISIKKESTSYYRIIPLTWRDF